jgi:pimeloyl-ACP methyl ester carboxylesterase
MNLRMLFLIPLLPTLVSCISIAEKFARHATALGFTRSVIRGADFQHVVYSKPGKFEGVLHVYLDGDGSPWIAGRPADDPTPRMPLVLDLMAQDTAPSIYVGRPCYHGLVDWKNCPSRFWLEERYSEAVVASLAAVIDRLLSAQHYQHIVWFGHSGGGTLAVLLAPRFSETAAVVTIAANFNVAAWGNYVGRLELAGSLNPASLPALPPSIRQFHYAGSCDKVAPQARRLSLFRLILMAAAGKHSGLKF